MSDRETAIEPIVSAAAPIGDRNTSATTAIVSTPSTEAAEPGPAEAANEVAESGSFASPTRAAAAAADPSVALLGGGGGPRAARDA